MAKFYVIHESIGDIFLTEKAFNKIKDVNVLEFDEITSISLPADEKIYDVEDLSDLDYIVDDTDSQLTEQSDDDLFEEGDDLLFEDYEEDDLA